MINEQYVLGIIPARGGSKGVPLKNIRMLCGKPLIGYTIEAAKKSAYLDRLVVSTDDEGIASVARSFDADVPFMRPVELASDSARSLGVVQHAMRIMEAMDGREYPVIAVLEPPAPLRVAADIDGAIELFAQEHPDSVVAVNEANQYHPALMKRIENGRLKNFIFDEAEGMPRQMNTPTAYMRNGAVYVVKRDNILAGIFYGNDVVPYVMPLERSICIDDMRDWYVAEAWMKSRES